MNSDQHKRVSALEDQQPELICVITHPVARLIAERNGLNPDAVTDTDRYILTLQARAGGYDSYPDAVRASAIEWDADLQRQIEAIQDNPPADDSSPYMKALYEQQQRESVND